MRPARRERRSRAIGAMSASDERDTERAGRETHREAQPEGRCLDDRVGRALVAQLLEVASPAAQREPYLDVLDVLEREEGHAVPPCAPRARESGEVLGVHEARDEHALRAREREQDQRAPNAVTALPHARSGAPTRAPAAAAPAAARARAHSR